MLEYFLGLLMLFSVSIIPIIDAPEISTTFSISVTPQEEFMLDHEYPEFEIVPEIDEAEEYSIIYNEGELPPVWPYTPEGFWTEERIEQWFEHIEAGREALPSLLPPVFE
jgi:hypothetical protein